MVLWHRGSIAMSPLELYLKELELVARVICECRGPHVEKTGIWSLAPGFLKCQWRCSVFDRRWTWMMGDVTQTRPRLARHTRSRLAGRQAASLPVVLESACLTPLLSLIRVQECVGWLLVWEDGKGPRKVCSLLPAVPTT